MQVVVSAMGAQGEGAFPICLPASMLKAADLLSAMKDEPLGVAY